MALQRKVPLGKAIRWFDEDDEVAQIEMATPDPETIELARRRWQAVRDRFVLLGEAELREDTSIIG